MPINTNQGKAYTLDELIKLGKINSFGPYNNAVVGALLEAKKFAKDVAALEDENKRLKGLIDEAMNEQYLRDVRNDSKKIMLRDYIPRLKEIYEICPDKELFLYGKCLFDIISNKEVASLDLLVKTKKIEDEIRLKLESAYNFNIKIDKDFGFADELFTVHSIYCDVKEIVTSDCVNIEGRFPALVDINKKNIRFTEKAKESLNDNPYIMLEAILLACTHGYNLEISTMKNIITNRELIKKIEARKIYNFLRDIFIKSEKPRKSISLINTLGISKELFGTLLVETSIVNNLNKKDVFEYFTIIFDSIPKDNLEIFLSKKVGFHLRDVDQILIISKLIELVLAASKRDVILARKVLDAYGVEKAMNACRLFKALGFTEFAAIIKKERLLFKPISNSGVTLELIMNSFNVNELEGKKLLDEAKKLVINEPDLANDGTKLLIALNKQISQEHLPA